VNFQQLVVTREQLEAIRQLRDPVTYEATRLDGPPRPFPDNSSGPVDFELKISS